MQEQLEQQLTSLIQLQLSQKVCCAFASKSSGASKSRTTIFSEFVQKFLKLQAELQLGFRPEDLDVLASMANDNAVRLSKTFSDDVAQLNELQSLADS